MTELEESQRKRVLIVDDDHDIRESLAEILSDEGYAVATAPNGLEAVELLRKGSPNPCVILLDLMMPVMDGFQFLAERAADPGLAAIPVIVITAGRMEHDKNALRGIEVVPKPFDLDHLLSKLAESCR